MKVNRIPWTLLLLLLLLNGGCNKQSAPLTTPNPAATNHTVLVPDVKTLKPASLTNGNAFMPKPPHGSARIITLSPDEVEQLTPATEQPVPDSEPVEKVRAKAE